MIATTTCTEIDEVTSTMPSSSSSSWKKNFNIYWFVSTLLAVWFLFVHSPSILYTRKVWNDPLFLLHLFGSYTIYLACVHNSLITPSLSKCTHIWLGRIGMIMGIVSFIAGLILSWTRIESVGIDCAIFISLGGLGQMASQYMGYRAIKRYQYISKELSERQHYRYMSNNGDRTTSKDIIDNDNQCQLLQIKKDEALKEHVKFMIMLFVLACGIPAVMRVLEDANMEQYSIWPILVVVGLFNLIAVAYSNQWEDKLNQQRQRQSQALLLPSPSSTSPLSSSLSSENGEDVTA